MVHCLRMSAAVATCIDQPQFEFVSQENIAARAGHGATMPCELGAGACVKCLL